MKNTFSKIGRKLSSLMPTKRRLIQLYAALLANANLKGFATGQIYQGPLKNLCTPGLNCYSCPGAAGACPLGALQNALASSNARVPYYVFGIILLFGVLFGRWICGFLCPFGLLQDLLHKIKTPKIKKSSVTRVLSYFKYVILALFTIILPLIYAFRDFPLPAFCKYICPAGTLGGALGLLLTGANNDLLPMLGPLFTWKFALLIAIVVGCIFFYRFFCRVLCPLGAIYGLFNRISLIGIKLDKPKCTDCGMCHAKCKMDIRHAGDAECISCGECISSCPTGAIRWSGSKFVLPPNEIDGAPASERVQKKYAKRRKVLKITACVLMMAVLLGALVYFNWIDKPSAVPGNQPGAVCYSAELVTLDETGLLDATFALEQNRGKVTVINFWGTWCGPCIEELPHFDAVASEYADQVTVLAVHTEYLGDTASAYIAQHYADSDMIFALDTGEAYYAELGGKGTYPMTVIVDAEGIVATKITTPLTYDELVRAVESALDH
ncbi:MAG: 4Fe-4S binding protein [Clostridia bacterium]|nr:4Fe-4S binding protein [Clostridia bacterium]